MRAILRSVRFIWILLFWNILVPRKDVIEKTKGRSGQTKNWISSSLLAPLQGKIMFN